MRPIVNALVSSGVAALLVTSALVFAQGPQGGPKNSALPKIRVKVLKQETRPAAPPIDADVERLLQPLLEIVKQPAARPVPPRGNIIVNGMVVNGPQDKAAQLKGLTQQFRTLLRVEYHFIRTVCALSPEQRQAIAREGERALRDTAARYAEILNHQVPRRFVLMNGRRVITPAYPNPRKQILEALARAVKEHATPEQAARYQAELDKREVCRKEVIVHNLVAKIDQEVMLSSEQRDQISAALLAHWEESWGAALSLTAVMNIDRYFPNLPREPIDAVLTDAQKRALRLVPVNQVFFNDNGVPGGAQGESLEDEELTEARQAADQAEQDVEKSK